MILPLCRCVLTMFLFLFSPTSMCTFFFFHNFFTSFVSHISLQTFFAPLFFLLAMAGGPSYIVISDSNDDDNVIRAKPGGSQIIDLSDSDDEFGSQYVVSRGKILMDNFLFYCSLPIHLFNFIRIC